MINGLIVCSMDDRHTDRQTDRQTEKYIKTNQSWFAITMSLNGDPKESCAKT